MKAEIKSFYRKPIALGEHFILKNLNKEIEAVLTGSIFSIPGEVEVLDIGCGNQPLRNFIEEKGYRYTGLDYQQNEKGSVEIIGFIDQPLHINKQFDLIICTEVLEHVFDWQKAFENMQAFCKKDGLILITCPMLYPLHEEPYDYWRPTPYAINRIATNFGLEIVKEQRLGGGEEALATILSYSYFYPAENNWKSRFLSKAAVRLRSIILNNLVSGNSKIKMESPFFMSNLFILKKRELVK